MKTIYSICQEVNDNGRKNNIEDSQRGHRRAE